MCLEFHTGVYDALHKRKLFLDSFGEGLEVFGILNFLQKFPAEMKTAFVSKGTLIPEDVLKMLKPRPITTADESKICKAVH